MSDKIASLAFEAAMMTHRSRRLLSLQNIKGNYEIVNSVTFKLPDGRDAICMSRKFNSISDVEKELSDPKKIYYVYQIYEFDVYGMDLKKTNTKVYSLRACVREK